LLRRDDHAKERLMRLSILTLGEIDLQNGPYILPSSLHEGDRVVVPVPGYLIETDDGFTILVDTGMPDHLVGPRVSAVTRSPFGEAMIPYVERENTVTAQLALLNLTPGDVDTVICTHFDWDHCGENALFGHARLLVQRSHLDAARAEKGDRYDLVPWALPSLTYTPLEGDAVVADGVRVKETPGHVAGHQSVVVSLSRDGVMVLCGDALVSREHLDSSRWDLYEDPTAARTSIEKLVALAEAERASLLYGHDPGQWASLKKAPYWYE